MLSGGSGKRLWPLSNDSYSKQFLRLPPTERGERESMIQRVVRQIQESKIETKITIATGENQKDAITSQLGAAVDVVTEPERRDTFPAIALAASYLKYHKKCRDNEVVVIMPCNPYTNIGYFQTIKKMAECADSNIADLVLMGITPTYPSKKYGYIVPAQENEKSFILYREAKERAQKLLSMNAL